MHLTYEIGKVQHAFQVFRSFTVLNMSDVLKHTDLKNNSTTLSLQKGIA